MTCSPSELPVADVAVDTFGRWHGELDLAYARRHGVTVPTRRRHAGPLRVQKHFFPEGPDVCQHIIVHPPGGIAGGDSLRIAVHVGDDAHVLLTSPGAAKWYCGVEESALVVDLQLARGAVLEWLPQETILFAGSRSRICNRIELAADAKLFFADVLCFGRPGSGERFPALPGGSWQQQGELWRDGRLLWAETAQLAAQDPLLSAAAGMGGATVLGTLLWAGPPVPAAIHQACVALPLRSGRCGVTQLPDVWSARCLCDSVEDAQHWLRGLWMLLRPAMLGRTAVPPRIWAT